MSNMKGKKLSPIQEKIDCEDCYCTWTVCTLCGKKLPTHNYNRVITHFKAHIEQSKLVIINVVVNPVCISTDYQDEDSYNHDYNVSTGSKDKETSSVVLTKFTGSS